MSDVYQTIKKHNGEAFAQTLRNYHNGLLEIEGIDQIVRCAGRDASAVLPYLMTLLMTPNDDVAEQSAENPFTLLDRAGYDAFYADTLDLQNSIEKYFQPGELLCTFNDAARHKDYHIVHAIKKDVDNIRRVDFKGHEQRQDAYGTSVISIQMLKAGGFISIKNRYNHAVASCDNTFNSNPDGIIGGLSASLKKHFDVDFSTAIDSFPAGFVLLGDRILKYYAEQNNFYYGDQVWGKDGVIHEVDRAAGDALFGAFLFDNKNKVLINVNLDNSDRFADDFNRYYGGNRGLSIRDGNLVLGEVVLIGAEHSRIKTLCLPALETMSYGSLYGAPYLEKFEANALVTMEYNCLANAKNLRSFQALALKKMEAGCLYESRQITDFRVGRDAKVPDYLEKFITPRSTKKDPKSSR